MEKLTMCDYINHKTFMNIKDIGGFYELLMKSSIVYEDGVSPAFYTLLDYKIDSYKYIMLFSKYDNNSHIQTDKINDTPPNS